MLLFGIPTREGYDRIQRQVSTLFHVVLVPEMRPQLLGATQVAQELVRRGVATTLISDNMAGLFFYRREVGRVYLCYDGRKENQAICRNGALLMANLARLHGVDLEFMPAGAAEQPPTDEDVTTFLGHRVSPEGISIYTPGEETIRIAVSSEQ